MQIILREKIRKLGGLGELLNVKPGYARNYLIPQGKAMMATKSNLEQFEQERANLEKVAIDALSTAEARLAQLKDMLISIAASAGVGGKLFGSIGTRDIAEAISKQGVEVHKHEVRMPNGVIRHTGEHEIDLHLHTDVNITIKVTIVPDLGNIKN